jgi:hypothetical protein
VLHGDNRSVLGNMREKKLRTDMGYRFMSQRVYSGEIERFLKIYVAKIVRLSGKLSTAGVKLPLLQLNLNLPTGIFLDFPVAKPSPKEQDCPFEGLHLREAILFS